MWRQASYHGRSPQPSAINHERELRIVLRRRLPETVIVLGALYCAGGGVHRLVAVDLGGPLSTENLLLLGLPAATAAALLLALLLPRAARARLALALASLCAAIFPAELYVASVPLEPKERAARAAGRPFDQRSPAEIVRELRSQAVDAVVQFRNVQSPLLTVGGPGGRVVPVLGGISRATTVYCNESGQYMIYTADEHGFNNPYGEHGRPPLQVVLIGDSFTHGACVPAKSSIAGRVRNVFLHTLNLGSGGSGPLSQFARFVEYAAPLRPRFVVWNWHENDLRDLHRELAQAPFRQYLTAQAPFGLKAQQAEIDRAARAAHDDALRRIPNEPPWLQGVRSFLLLRSIRKLIRNAIPVVGPRAAPTLSDDGPDHQAKLAVVERILATVRDAARSWDGELLMVYLPGAPSYCGVVRLRSWRRFCRSIENGRRHWSDHRDDMLALFAHLDLPIVDGHVAFEEVGRPADMFYYPGSHYSPAGYRVIADALLRVLTAGLTASEGSPAAATRTGRGRQRTVTSRLRGGLYGELVEIPADLGDQVQPDNVVRVPRLPGDSSGIDTGGPPPGSCSRR